MPSFLRRSLVFAALLSLVSAALHAESEEGGFWRVDFAAAEAEAQEANLPLLLFFTGSDWCVWCQKLEAELFAEPGFHSAAGEIFIPVMLDFPRRTSLPIRTERQNRLLQRRFGVEAFPTVIWLCPSTDSELHRHGYVKMVPGEYLKAFQRAASRCKNEP